MLKILRGNPAEEALITHKPQESPEKKKIYSPQIISIKKSVQLDEEDETEHVVYDDDEDPKEIAEDRALVWNMAADHKECY